MILVDLEDVCHPKLEYSHWILQYIHVIKQYLDLKIFHNEERL